MMVLTQRGRVYKFVGRWDDNMIFAPDDGIDDEVMIYSITELKELLKTGRLLEIQRSMNPCPS